MYKRQVVDSCLRIALTSNVLKDQENNQTILATTNQASPLAARKLETFGSKVLYCSSKDNRVDLNDLMNQLGAMGAVSYTHLYKKNQFILSWISYIYFVKQLLIVVSWDNI